MDQSATELTTIPEQATVVVVTPAPKPNRLDDGDRLLLENKYLQMKNLELQRQLLVEESKTLQARANHTTAMLADMQKDIASVIEALSTKYGRAITPTAINPDGTFKDPPTGS